MVNPVIVWNEAILKSLTSLKIHVLSMVIDFFKLFLGGGLAVGTVCLIGWYFL